MFSRTRKWFKEIRDLKYLAYHDELTGLHNRHYLNSLSVDKYKYVYFIDINDLKNYNQEGHINGDNHIISCISYIKHHYVSKEDCFVRYAGDEFVLLTTSKIDIRTNHLFSVGEAVLSGSFKSCVEIADRRMIVNKNKFKFKK